MHFQKEFKFKYNASKSQFKSLIDVKIQEKMLNRKDEIQS